MNLIEWHDFFIGAVGAAAALTGLIFVGVSINIKKILSLPKLPDRAFLSLVLLMTILVISLLMLIPLQTSLTVGTEISLIAISSYLLVTKMDIAIYRGTNHSYKKQYATSIIFNQLSLFPYLIASITIFIYQENGIYWLGPAFVFSFLKAVVDAWVLLVEINR